MVLCTSMRRCLTMMTLPPLRLISSATAFVLGMHISFSLAGDAAPEQRPNGLVRIPNSRAQLVYIRPGTDLSKYRTIELRSLHVPEKVRDAAPSGTRSRGFESYVLRDQDVAALQEAYDKAMREQLSRAGYTFVTTPGPDTLIVEAQIIDIKLAAPIESTRRSYSGGGFVVSRGGGSMAIAAAFGDGATNQVIAEAADRSLPGNVWGVNNSVTNRAEVRRAFTRWASALREGLSRRRVSVN